MILRVSLHFLYKCVSFTHDNCPIYIYIIMINDKRVFFTQLFTFFLQTSLTRYQDDKLNYYKINKMFKSIYDNDFVYENLCKENIFQIYTIIV